MNLSSCKLCSSDYIPCEPYDPTTDNVFCMTCDKTAHKSCYTKESMDPENGVVYLCTECLKAVKASRMETIKLVNTVEIQIDTREKPTPTNTGTPDVKDHGTDDSDTDEESDNSDDGYTKVEKQQFARDLRLPSHDGICILIRG